MRNRLILLLLLCSACGDDAGSTNYDAGNGNTMDAPEFAPSLTSFQATPSQVPAGTPTMVTWNWTFAVEPTFPEPSCTIDNGVGAVTKGQQTSVTISSVTTFTISCTNSAGTAMRQLVIGVPPAAPVLATFTATPTSTMTANQAGNITFAWTYSNAPVPPPVCVVDGGIGTVTNGQTVSVTLPQARQYRLRCTNGAGTSFRDATLIGVNECGVTSQCNANATCAETLESYTCTCNNGFTGDGDQCFTNCSADPNVCDASAPCNGTYCAVPVGSVGTGAIGNVQRLRLSFVTSTTGNGNISTWAGATGTGLAAADAVCTARATAAGLPGVYKAWLSDATDDAYCRMHNLTGKRANNCGETLLPTTAGPWVRTSSDRRPFAPPIAQLTGASRITFYASAFNESGTEIASGSDRVWTGTDENGVYATNACSNWTSNSTAFQGVAGYTHGGGSSWTKPNTAGTSDPLCSQTTYRLRCMEVAATGPGSAGPALPPRHPTTTKRAFLTSVSGTGQFSTWTDANAQTGINAADQVCQARARYAGYANAAAFKAWMSSSSSLTSRIINTSYPYARPDGVLLGTSRADMLDGKLAAGWYQTELGTYVNGNLDTGVAWTGSYYYGSLNSSYYCSAWGQAQSFYYGYFWRYDMLDVQNTTTYLACDQTARMYCVED